MTVASYLMLNIPYTNRKGYYNALERTQTKKMGSIFVSWFFRSYEKTCKRYAT